MIQPDLGHRFEVLLRQIGSFCFSVLSETTEVGETPAWDDSKWTTVNNKKSVNYLDLLAVSFCAT